MIARVTATLLVVFCAASVATARAEMRFGVNGHPISAYSDIPYEEQIRSLADLGLTGYRVDIRNVDDGGKLEQLIVAARARNVTILPVLTPGFDLDKELPADLYRKSFDLAVALVARFKADIRVWELGNELENYAIIKPCEKRDDGTTYDCAWGAAGGVGPLDYVGPRWEKVSAVLKGLSEGAASADPGVKRAIGTAGWGHVGAFARMKADGIPWDISVWHMYGEDPEWAFKQLVNYERPIWVTEFNHPFGSRDGEEQQAKGLKDAIKRLRDLSDRYDVEAAFIYELLDEPYWAPDYESVMGLVQVDGDRESGWRLGRPKAAYGAVQEILGGQAGVPAIETIEAADAAATPITRRRCKLEPFRQLLVVTTSNRVGYAFCVVLGRRADVAGATSWSKDLTRSISIETMLLAMLGSDEFIGRAGPRYSDTGVFVATMYRLLLDRPVDGAGYAAYVTRLDKGSMTRTDMQRELIQSNEFKAKHAVLFEAPAPAQEPFVPQPVSEADAWRSCNLAQLERGGTDAEHRIAYGYCLVLGRNADSAGRESYAEWLREGKPVSSVLTSLIESDEFQERARRIALDDQKFVALIYSLLLNRSPDEHSLEGYAARLGSRTLTRAQLAGEIITSEEFRRRQPFLYPEG